MEVITIEVKIYWALWYQVTVNVRSSLNSALQPHYQTRNHTVPVCQGSCPQLWWLTWAFYIRDLIWLSQLSRVVVPGGMKLPIWKWKNDAQRLRAAFQKWKNGFEPRSEPHCYVPGMCFPSVSFNIDRFEVLDQGQFCLPRGHLTISGDGFSSYNWGVLVLIASSVYRLECF